MSNLIHRRRARLALILLGAVAILAARLVVSAPPDARSAAGAQPQVLSLSNTVSYPGFGSWSISGRAILLALPPNPTVPGNPIREVHTSVVATATNTLTGQRCVAADVQSFDAAQGETTSAALGYAFVPGNPIIPGNPICPDDLGSVRVSFSLALSADGLITSVTALPVSPVT
jgi:hypothetical protein